jgi:hypothetical protein
MVRCSRCELLEEAPPDPGEVERITGDLATVQLLLYTTWLQKPPAWLQKPPDNAPWAERSPYEDALGYLIERLGDHVAELRSLQSRVLVPDRSAALVPGHLDAGALK